MTISEVKSIISKSSQADQYNSYEFLFDFDYVLYSKKITGLSSLYDFVNQQLTKWSEINTLPLELLESKKYFQTISDQIIRLLNNDTNEEQLINRYSPSTINQINQTIGNKRNYPLPYDIPEVDFLIKVHTTTPASMKGAFAIITNSMNRNPFSSRNDVIGIIQAYEFLQKDNSIISERRNVEKKSLNNLRNEFNKYVNQIEIATIETIKNSKEKYIEHFEEISNIKSDRVSKVDEWFENSKNSYLTFYTESSQKIGTLENTYEEIIRLKKPADYWKERATDLKKEGDKFFRWLLIAVGIAIVTLYSLLWLTPEGMQKTFFNEDKSLAIRWSIIYITFISFLFFAIKAIMKSMFSAYHLSRDAEERHRLTYVYLAMIKDSAIEKEDRHLVMQSLFSRADTGLLKEDSSPSMPGAAGVIDIVKK